MIEKIINYQKQFDILTHRFGLLLHRQPVHLIKTIKKPSTLTSIDWV